MPPTRRPPRPPHLLTSLSPRRLALQILLLQILYYTSITLLLLFTSLTLGSPFHPSLLWDWHTIRADTTTGWTLGLGVWLIGGSLTGSILLLTIIGRSKLVPDFVVTLHVLHGMAVCGFTRAVPRNGAWWVLQAGSMGVMGAGGMWGCRWRELRPMGFGGGGKGKEGGGGAPGRGEYEMVAQVEDGRG